MTSDTLAMLFRFSCGTVQQNCAGLTHADSLRQPEGGGNCLNWVVGHILASRRTLLRLLGEAEGVWDDPRAARYVRGSQPVTDADDTEVVPLEELLALYAASQERLLSALEGLTPERLAERIPDGLPHPAGAETFEGAISFLHFHETYHAGQVGLLRRICGLEGTIK